MARVDLQALAVRYGVDAAQARRLLEPGWAGATTPAEARYIRAAVRADARLRRRWMAAAKALGWPRLSLAAVQAVAMWGGCGREDAIRGYIHHPDTPPPTPELWRARIRARADTHLAGDGNFGTPGRRGRPAALPPSAVEVVRDLAAAGRGVRSIARALAGLGIRASRMTVWRALQGRLPGMDAQEGEADLG